MKAKKLSDNGDLAIILGDNLRKMMLDKGITIKELSHDADIVYNQLSGYTRGEHLPTGDVLHRLCTAMNCSIDDLLPVSAPQTCTSLADGSDADYQAFKAEEDGKETNVLEMAKAFGTRCVKLFQFLTSQKSPSVDYVLAHNVLHNGSQIGAILIQSNSDFYRDKKEFYKGISKAIDCSKQTEYWIELLAQGNYLTKEMHESLKADLKSIKNVLFAIIRKRKDENKK